MAIAVLVRHHAHHFLALHFGAERAADAAIGTGRDRRCVRPVPFRSRSFPSASRSGRPARRRRRKRIRSPGTARPGWRRPWNRSRGPGWSMPTCPARSSQARTQREQTMHLVGSKVKYGLDSSLTARAGDSRPRSRSALRASRPRRPCPAVRSGRWPGRSGSRADDPRYTVPSRRGGSRRAWRSACVTFMPCATGVVQEAGKPFMPSICTRHKPAGAERFELFGGAQLRNLHAGLRGGAHDRSAFGHPDLVAVDCQRRPASRLSRCGVPRSCSSMDIHGMSS